MIQSLDQLQNYYAYCPYCGQPYSEQQRSTSAKLCDFCKLTMYENQSATVGALIQHENQVLLVRRAVEPSKGAWDIPGGFVNPNETAEDAIKREVEEETGLKVEVNRLLGIYGPTWYVYQNRGQYNTDIFYVMTTKTQQCQPSDDVDLCQWFSLDELPTKESIAFPSVHKALEDLVKIQTEST